MHFIISWDIPVTVQNRETLEAQLVGCFSRFTHLKPLNTFYIVQVPTQADYSSIIASLQNVALPITDIKLVVSPIMNGGRYDGVLKTYLWTTINEISG